MTSVINQVAYLRTSREFPSDDLKQLSVELNKTYVDTASAVNNKTIGIFPVNKPAINGEAWFLSNAQKQQGLRQVYQFTAVGTYPHGLTSTSIGQFTKPSGTATDGTNSYGVIYGSNVAIAGQLSFYITPTNIVILSGAGAPVPINITIILEWITQNKFNNSQ